MKRFLFILFALSLFSCTHVEEEKGKPLVAVSILPQRYLVSSIADTLVDVVVMVPPGASPATWELTPAQMKDLEDAFLYVRIGHIGFEQAWMSKISSLNPEMQVVDLSMNLELISVDYSHGDHSHRGTDPHTWMSPGRMRTMARDLYQVFSDLYPDKKEYLRENYRQLLQEIASVEGQARLKLKPLAGKSFLIFHPALGYLAQDFGLHQHAIEFEGKEPSPAHMKEIVDMAKSEGIRAVFVQQEFDQRNAELIAKEIGGNIVWINPLEENWPAGIRKTINSLEKNIK